MGVSTPSTLMPTSMGVTNLKFAKSVRKPKKIKHCTIPEWQQAKKNFPSVNYRRELGAYSFE